jgi:hypothetical protein
MEKTELESNTDLEQNSNKRPQSLTEADTENVSGGGKLATYHKHKAASNLLNLIFGRRR